MGSPAARITDLTVHPLPGVLTPGPGSPNVLIGYLPAWRGIPALAAAGLQAAKAVADTVVQVAEAATVAAAGTPGAPAAIAAEKATKAASAAAMGAMINGLAAASATPSGGTPDIHVCATPPLPPPPHGPGVVIDGSPTVLINGLPACVVGDTVLEAFGPANKIIMGWPTVIIGDGSAGGGGGMGALAGLLSSAISSALATVNAIKDFVNNTIDYIVSFAEATIRAIVEGARNFANTVIDAVIRGITDVTKSIVEAVQKGAAALRPSKVKGMDADAADAAITQAQKDAVAALDKRIKDLDNWDAETQKSFEKWFGSTDGEARKKIRERMVKAKEKLEGFTLDNYAADDDAYAYVYPDKDDKMYLGELFAKAPATGPDSKAGTLIHEASHYNSVGGTDDVEHDGHTVYGRKGAEKLAKEAPEKAMQNADNFEYFVEDGM